MAPATPIYMTTVRKMKKHTICKLHHDHADTTSSHFRLMANSLDAHATEPQHFQQEHQHLSDHLVNGVATEAFDKFVKKTNDSKQTTTT